jgi:predicted RNA binding protein YcfA (HicA-like mRNA interferase family)
LKRRELIRHLEAQGCPLKREGGAHSIYWNPATGRREPVPWHNEIPDLLVRKICRALGISEPGHWR